MDLLAWLERYIFPLERSFDVATAERVAPAAWRAFAAAGTTTALVYGAVYEASLDATFRAAEAHGIRAIVGKVMMDRITYDPTIEPSTILDRSLAESARLIERWHGRRWRSAAVRGHPALRRSRARPTCCANRRRSPRRPGRTGRHTCRRTDGEIAEVRRLFPDALDYVDVYDRAGGLGPRTVLAHAVHLSDRELDRLVETGTRVAHCPVSNLFLASGVMPLGRYLDAGLSVGLGSDVAGGPDLSIFSVMRVGFYAQNARRVAGLDPGRGAGRVVAPLDWLRLGTLSGAEALGLGEIVGSLETGKEADVIAIDPAYAAPIPGIVDDDPEDLASRLIFRCPPRHGPRGVGPRPPPGGAGSVPFRGGMRRDIAAACARLASGFPRAHSCQMSIRCTLVHAEARIEARKRSPDARSSRDVDP